LEDCGSRNGTWVNGVRVADNATIALADGDIIEAASARYLFYFVLRVDT
jgi:pSer/pThr/pTyr-binding forkhead associated (FHA) protein